MSTRADIVPAPGFAVSAVSVAAAPSPRNRPHGWPTPSSKPPLMTCSPPVGGAGTTVGDPDAPADAVGAADAVGLGPADGDALAGGDGDGAGDGGVSASASSAACSSGSCLISLTIARAPDSYAAELLI